MPIILLSAELGLHTRCRRQVNNLLDVTPVPFGMTFAANEMEKRYPGAIPRPTKPTGDYNCHGLTFASRRTCVDPVEVTKILSDDGYLSVVVPEVPRPGDIIVYFNSRSGDVEHSGHVVSIDKSLGPIILSKWGTLREYLHPVMTCPYDPEKLLIIGLSDETARHYQFC